MLKLVCCLWKLSVTDCVKIKSFVQAWRRKSFMHRSKVFCLLVCRSLSRIHRTHETFSTFLSKLKEPFPQKNWNFGNPVCSYIYFNISLSNNYTPQTRKLTKDKRIINLNWCSTDMAIKNENVHCMSFLVTLPLKKLDQHNRPMFRCENKDKLQVPFALKYKSSH